MQLESMQYSSTELPFFGLAEAVLGGAAIERDHAEGILQSSDDDLPALLRAACV
jgi:hypothetical protein